jgi:hypothetical protein
MPGQAEHEVRRLAIHAARPRVSTFGVSLDARMGDLSGERGDPVPPVSKDLPTDEEHLRVAGEPVAERQRSRPR